MASDKTNQLMGRFHGIVPLKAKWLHENAPDLFPSKKAAEKWIKKLYPPSSNRTIRAGGVKLGVFRKQGQRGPKPTRFLYKERHPVPHLSLELLFGDLAEYDGPEGGNNVEYLRLPGNAGTFGFIIRQRTEATTAPRRNRAPINLQRTQHAPMAAGELF